MPRVSLVKLASRYESVYRALELIEDDIKEKISKAKRIVIKPNFVSVNNQLATTHKDTTKALLDFLFKWTKEKVIIAEGSALGDTFEAFRNFGYFDLKNDYNLEFFDLNSDQFLEVKLFDKNLNPLSFRFSKTLAEADFLISPVPMKTHDTVIVTLSGKNIAVGGLIKDSFRDDKAQIHQGYRAINLNIAKLLERFGPDLGIVDGWEAMEGEGPVAGKAKFLGIALASKDFVALDSVSAFIMGFEPKDIGYLYFLAKEEKGEIDLNNIEIVGNVLVEKIKTKFTPHSTYKEQLSWKKGYS